MISSYFQFTENSSRGKDDASISALTSTTGAIAEERKIPRADFAKLMHKRISTFAIMQFCTKHKISHDWLLCGDLKGLARMEQRRKDAEAMASHPGGAQGYFLKIFCSLDEEHQETAIRNIRVLAREQMERGS